ncbi:MAG: hypothetical protein HC919_02360 [Oscillatoriales cyanobacterium SM2_2_1]|nr:hypothetical protein [Oscillatoriales cyanobacterium SM2_2_1]
MRQFLRLNLLSCLVAMGIAVSGAIAQVPGLGGNNVVVYVLGSDEAIAAAMSRLGLAPVVGPVNGRVSTIAGAYPPSRAAEVLAQLQQQGLAARQTAPGATYDPRQGIIDPTASAPSPLPLPSDTFNPPPNPSQFQLPTTFDGARRYITMVPIQGDRDFTLSQIRQWLPSAFVQSSPLGTFIYAGGFLSRDEAESLQFWLRSQGIPARVLFF